MTNNHKTYVFSFPNGTAITKIDKNMKILIFLFMVTVILTQKTVFSIILPILLRIQKNIKKTKKIKYFGLIFIGNVKIQKLI